MIFNVTGNGGTAMNFRVVGGTTAPSNPKENTIWINTSSTITDWVFSATQPSSVNGRVWISTGTSSTIEFNALKKNGIQVYPLKAKQYISGMLVEKTAMSYQNGEWVLWWNGELYTPGNEWESVTGGWGSRAWKWANNSIYQPYAPGKRNTSEYMEITLGGSKYGCGVVEVLKDQDLRNVNTIKINFEATIKNCDVRLVAIDRNSAYIDGFYDAIVQMCIVKDASGMTSTGIMEVPLDVSTVNKACDIVIACVCGWTTPSEGTIKVYSVTME